MLYAPDHHVFRPATKPRIMMEREDPHRLIQARGGQEPIEHLLVPDGTRARSEPIPGSLHRHDVEPAPARFRVCDEVGAALVAVNDYRTFGKFFHADPDRLRVSPLSASTK
jgi:hypothetical protein